MLTLLLTLNALAAAPADCSLHFEPPAATRATHAFVCPLPEAVDLGQPHRCELLVDVGSDGTASPTPQRCHSSIAAASVDAVKTWRFETDGSANQVRMAMDFEPEAGRWKVFVRPLPLAEPLPPPPEPINKSPDEFVEELVELKVENRLYDVPGVEDGVPGGVEGGIEGGVIGGQLDSTPVVHHSELRIKRRVNPQYPDAAKVLELGDVMCKATVKVDTRGKVLSVGVSGCPKLFEAPVVDALEKWMFYPYKVDGQAREAQTVIGIQFIANR